MTKIREYLGIYKRVGNQLINTSGVKLLIGSRSNITNNKTNHFLLDKSTKSGTYISSLYYVSDSTYRFDYKSYKYVLELKEEEAIIQSA